MCITYKYILLRNVQLLFLYCRFWKRIFLTGSKSMKYGKCFFLSSMSLFIRVKLWITYHWICELNISVLVYESEEKMSEFNYFMIKLIKRKMKVAIYLKNKLETKEEKPTAFVEQRLMSNLGIDRWNANLHKHSPITAIVEEDGWYVQKKGKLCLNGFGKCGCNVLANAKLKWSIPIVVSAPWKRKRVWRNSSFWPCRCFVYHMTPTCVNISNHAP